MEKIKKQTIGATLFFLMILLADYFLMGITGHAPIFITLSMGFCTFLLALLLLANLWLCTSSKQRLPHAALCVVIIISFAVHPFFAEWRTNTLRNKFLNVQLPVYQSIVRNIDFSVMGHAGELQSPAGITRSKIFAQRNKDKSTTVLFYDTLDRIHGGYMYYNGHELVPENDKPNEYVFRSTSKPQFTHLTNDWYEFYK